MRSPPPLLRPSLASRLAPPLSFLFFLILSFSAYSLIRLNLSLPPCSMRLFFALPCLFCGGTRSLASLFSLDLYASLQFNPLVFSLSFFIVFWFLLSLWTSLSRSYRPVNPFLLLPSLFQSRPLLLVLLASLIIHWLYLCHNLAF